MWRGHQCRRSPGTSFALARASTISPCRRGHRVPQVARIGDQVLEAGPARRRCRCSGRRPEAFRRGRFDTAAAGYERPPSWSGPGAGSAGDSYCREASAPLREGEVLLWHVPARRTEAKATSAPIARKPSPTGGRLRGTIAQVLGAAPREAHSPRGSKRLRFAALPRSNRSAGDSIDGVVNGEVEALGARKQKSTASRSRPTTASGGRALEREPRGLSVTRGAYGKSAAASTKQRRSSNTATPSSGELAPCDGRPSAERSGGVASMASTS